MIFSSALYIFLFLPIAFLVWRVAVSLGRESLVTLVLVLASLVFYGSWNVLYLPLIVGSVLFNYLMSLAIASARTKPFRGLGPRPLLAFGVLCNLGTLALFKYTDFFLFNWNMIANGAGPFLLHLTLPLGISFFTFQQIAFLVDTSRGEVEDHSFLNYALFVTFFPQLIAGPIVHHKEMMPQFADPARKKVDYGNIALALFVFGIGLFKKVVLADTFSTWVGAGFDSMHLLSVGDAWVSVLSYTLQIYFDFSGYTDMAIGSALLFNIRLPINFNSPYKSASISEFWRRWHITLGRWLRDYLYIPLGGSRQGVPRTLLNLFVVMLLGGLWHGAGWTFVVWGVLHGVMLMVNAVWSRTGIVLPRIIAQTITFVCVLLAWVPFRAYSLESATMMWSSMFSGKWAISMTDSYPWLVAGVAIVFFLPNSMQLAGFIREYTGRLRFRVKSPVHAILTGVLLALATTWMLASTGTEFIYFNF